MTEFITENIRLIAAVTGVIWVLGVAVQLPGAHKRGRMAAHLAAIRGEERRHRKSTNIWDFYTESNLAEDVIDSYLAARRERFLKSLFWPIAVGLALWDGFGRFLQGLRLNNV